MWIKVYSKVFTCFPIGTIFNVAILFFCPVNVILRTLLDKWTRFSILSLPSSPSCRCCIKSGCARPRRCLQTCPNLVLSFILPALTIAGDERPVEPAVRVQLAPLGWSFAGRSLHEELVFVEVALFSAIQWLALLLERAPGLFYVRLPFTRNKRGAVFGFSGRESPELVIPTLRSRCAVVRIHRCHVAVWDARRVHT